MNTCITIIGRILSQSSEWKQTKFQSDLHFGGKIR